MTKINAVLGIFILLLTNIIYGQDTIRKQTCQDKDMIDRHIYKRLTDWISIYEQIHSTPELSGFEDKTSSLIAYRLKELGYQVTDHMGKYINQKWKGYGVVGVLRNGIGPVVMIRTEMDALPLLEKTNLPYASHLTFKSDSGEEINIMHACGHDIHMAVFLGVAEILMHTRADWCGTILLVGQPAEEGGPGASGAEAMLGDGLFTRFPKPDFILGLHQIPSIMSGKVSVMAGYSNATSRDGEIIVKGVGSHAARPQDSKDPIVISAELILALQTIVSRENNPMHPAVFTVGSIHGGTKSNIIPDRVNLKFTLRTLDDATSDKLSASVFRIAKGVGYTAGLDESIYPEVRMHKGYPSNYNDPVLAEELTALFKTLLGTENVLPGEPVLSGEDFSYYSMQKSIPALFYNIGGADPVKFNESIRTGIPLPSNHSPNMTTLPGLTIKTGVETMVSAALFLLQKQNVNKLK